MGSGPFGAMMPWEMEYQPHRCRHCGAMKATLLDAVQHECDPVERERKRQDERVLRALERCSEAQWK
jgi:hypothetical protein